MPEAPQWVASGPAYIFSLLAPGSRSVKRAPPTRGTYFWKLVVPPRAVAEMFRSMASAVRSRAGRAALPCPSLFPAVSSSFFNKHPNIRSLHLCLLYTCCPGIISNVPLSLSDKGIKHTPIPCSMFSRVLPPELRQDRRNKNYVGRRQRNRDFKFVLNHSFKTQKLPKSFVTWKLCFFYLQGSSNTGGQCISTSDMCRWLGFFLSFSFLLSSFPSFLSFFLSLGC